MANLSVCQIIGGAESSVVDIRFFDLFGRTPWRKAVVSFPPLSVKRKAVKLFFTVQSPATLMVNIYPKIISKHSINRSNYN